VAVIGTGSTAVQLVPPLAKRAAHLTVFQRTPNWILPRLERRYRFFDRWLTALPGYSRATRLAWAAFLEWGRKGFDEGTFARRFMLALAGWHRRRQLPDAALRDALAPPYPLGCKRIIYANDYYPTLMQPHVDLVTAGIDAVLPTGVRTSDGREHALDALVCATGFETVQLLASIRIEGREGRTLSETWKDVPAAFHGISVAGFPNLFLMLGPNTATGHTSTLFYIEAAVRHAVAGIQRLTSTGGISMEVRQDAMDAHNAALQARLGNSVWAQCRSWYRSPSGKVVAIFPGFTPEYVRAASTLRPEDYHWR
jgi:cation diffusion facilitator CzcD-associated flavoprotein CzcO